MKRKLLFAILLALVCANSSAQILIDEVGVDSLTSFASSQAIPVRADFTYDDAGNVIRQMVIYYNPPPFQLSEVKEKTMTIDDFDAIINADETWTNVCVAITNLKTNETANISIYSISGFNCYTGKIENGNTSMNLSYLKKGLYLFVISSKSGNKSYKLIKH